MKSFLVFTLIASMFLNTVVVTSASAGDNRKGYRYKVKYKDWNRGFTRRYNYSEENCAYSGSRSGYAKTCYEFNPDDDIYVEERNDRQYSRVTVYRDEGRTRPYVSYYTYDDGRRHHVGRRHFHPDYRYYNDSPYYSEAYYTPYYQTVVWVPIDWDNGWDRIFVGVSVGLAGVQKIIDSRSKGGKIAGGVVVGIGIISIISGIKKNKKESDLQRAIDEAAQDDLSEETSIEN